MIHNIVGGGGGASLNYKVIGGTTQPSSASENTIWVNTDTEITSHVFSATEPTNPAAGMVWFSVGVANSAPINVLKDNNTLMVYPVSCKQYVSGEWVSKTAKTYQSGAWVEWVLYLYKGAEDMTAVSGGWVKYSGSGTVTDRDGVLDFYIPALQWGANSGVMRHETAVDMSTYSSIVISCYLSEYVRSNAIFRVYDESGESVCSVNAGTVVGQTIEVTMDITDLTGEYYFGLSLGGYWDGTVGLGTSVSVYEVKLVN